jgi:hypothetical protein
MMKYVSYQIVGKKLLDVFLTKSRRKKTEFLDNATKTVY